MSWLNLVTRSLGGHRRLIAAALALSIVDALLVLAAPWPLEALANVLQDGEPSGWFASVSDRFGITDVVAQIALIAVLQVLIVAIRQGSAAAVALVNTVLTRRLTHGLGGRVLDRVLRRSAAYDGVRSTGDDVSRIVNDSKVAQDVVVAIFIPAVHGFVSIGLMSVVLFRLDPALTAITLGVALPLAVSVRVQSRRMTAFQYDASVADGEVWTTADRSLSAIAEVQLFRAEPRLREDFSVAADRRVQAELASTRAVTEFELSNSTLTAIALALILVVGGRKVLDGDLTVGELLVANAYVALLFSPINTLAFLGASYASATANGRRLLEVFERDDQVSERPTTVGTAPRRGRIVFENARFAYGSSPNVLDGLDLTIEPGETVAIVGPTGCGKSTMARLIPRFMDVTGGTVRIDDVDVRDYPLTGVRSATSIVTQDPMLVAGTIAENIAFAREGTTDDELREAARQANALDFIEELPNGFDTVIGERGATLSGGQQQRIAIARAIIRDAPILILDEPTSALDEDTEYLVVDALRKLTSDRTTIIISHRPGAIVHADRVVHLDRGMIVTDESDTTRPNHDR
jgi:ATP-binding cassette subfamily B protein/subfamily B ATP-binding cassette protein MsbA